VRDDQQQQAVRDVKGSLILEHIGDRENVAVTDEEIDQEVERIAAETNRPKEKVHEVLNRDSGMSRLKTQLRNKKILDILQARASIQAATAASSD
jgi:trigger factor